MTIKSKVVAGKDPRESKTLWFNGVALVVAILGHYGLKAFEPAPEVQVIADGLVAFVTVGLPIIGPVVNIVLRFVTRERIVALRR